MIVIENAKVRGFIKTAFPFIFIPALVILGAVVFDSRKHIIISLGVALLTLFGI